MTASAFINNLPRGLISPIHGIQISDKDIKLDNVMEPMGGYAQTSGSRTPLLDAKDLLQPPSYLVQKSDDINEVTPSRDSILQLVRLMNLNGKSESDIFRTQSVLGYSNNDNQVDSRLRSKSDGHLKLFHEFFQDDPFEVSKREIEGSAPEEEVRILNILISEIESNPEYSFAIDSKNIGRRSKQLLKNSSWKTRFEVLNLISDLLPKLGADFDAFFSKLLISVINNLGHNKEVVGNAAKDLIKLFSLITKDKKYFVDVLIASGLHNKDSTIRKATIKNIPNFLNEEFMHLDLFNVIKVLTKVCQKDMRCRKEVEKALLHIRYLEGYQGFNKHQMMLSPRSKKKLSELTSFYNAEEYPSPETSLKEDSGKTTEEEEIRSAINLEEDSRRRRKRFGLINGIITDKISKENSPVMRRQGCEELICLLEEAESLEGLFPHMDTYLSFLSSLRDDPDFTVATTSLRVTSILLQKARGERINRTLPSLVHTVARIFGDDRHVVRSEAAKVFSDLLQKTSPSRVTSILCDDLVNRSSRIREHSLNLLTSALMTFPSDMFDLAFLCQKVVPTLTDQKRRVRQGALENIATIAQGLGNERAYILMKKVLLLEKTEEGRGVTAAVQARLNRRTLPKLTVESLVEYSLKVYPTQKRVGKEKTSQGLDVEWILKASGSLSNGSIYGSTTSSGSNFHGWDQPDWETRDLSSSLPQPLLMSAMRTRSVNNMERKRSYSEVTLNQVIPGGYVLLGAQGGHPLLDQSARSRSYPGGLLAPLEVSSTIRSRADILENRPIHTVLVPPVASITSLPLSAPILRRPTTGVSQEELEGMWKVVGGNPHWEGHSTKKMWSPLPVTRRDPIRLPFLEVTPTTVLERLRGQAPKDTSEEDRGPLALWSAEPIDLARTAPADFGSYRGVQYLGKLRQGSALSRSVNSEKGFALLPNKYASGGVGSARANERGGLVSPPALSPVPRRLYALEPLDQTDGGSSGLPPPTLTKIPPLRSAAKSGLVAKRIHGSGFDRFNYKDEDEDSEDDTLDEEDEVEEDDDEEEEQVEEEQIDEAVEVSQKGSSAETRDSGISMLSNNQEDLIVQGVKTSKISLRNGSTSQIPVRTVKNIPQEDYCEPEDETTPRNTTLEEATEEHLAKHNEEIENTTNSDPIEQELRDQSESIGRNSYETLKQGGLEIRGGRVRRGSTNSLPSALNVRQQNLNVQGKGIVTEVSTRGGQRRLHPGGPPTKIPNIKKTNNNIVFNSLDYESDFESEDENGGARGNFAMTRMKILKKKRDTMREIERKLTEKEAEEAKEQRLKRYKELELRHSGNSLPITRPNSDPEEKSKYHFSRSNSKPSPRPTNLHVSTIPKSRSHDQNLHLKSLSTEPLRPHSLDRSPISNKLPFSRAPTFGRNRGGGGNKNNSGGRSPIATTILPSYFSDPLASRRSTPGIGFDRPVETKGVVSFSKPSSNIFNNNNYNRKNENVASKIISGSLAAKFRTSSENNLSTGGNFAPNIRRSALDLGLDRLQLFPNKQAINYDTSKPNLSKNVSVPVFRHLKSYQRSKTVVVDPPKNSPSLTQIPPYKYPINNSKRDNTNSDSKQKTYFEINLEREQTDLKNKTKRKPTLPSAINRQSKFVSNSGTRNTAALSEADIESVAFSAGKKYSTVQGRNFREYPSPKDALRSGLDLLRNNEWEEQLDGVLCMGRLAAFHPEMLTSDLREINALLMKHAKNLRSQVSRTSIQVIMMFFDLLKRSMEPDLDKFVALLLHKTSDTNKFIKEDSNSSLDIIVDNITPSKAVGSIISEGINHKSPQVRTTVARLLAYSAERYSAAKTLKQKEVAERILPALTRLAQEGSHETRRYAKIAFQRLSTEPNFETVLKKYVSNDELRNIQKVLNTLGSESRGGEETAKNRAGKGGGLSFRR